MFKVGDRVWSAAFKETGEIKNIRNKLYFVDFGKISGEFLESELHQTADDMFKELGFENKSATTKGWFLIEKDFGSYIEEIRIDLFTGDYKKSRIFPEDKMMWSGTFTKEEHLAIHQKLIELGWL